MYFKLSKEISEDVYDKAEIITELSSDLSDYFKYNTYGNGIESIVIGIICLNQKFDFFFKKRFKYKNKAKLLEYDIKINHSEMLISNRIEIKRMIISEIIETENIITGKKFDQFDAQKFFIDLKTWDEKNLHD